MNAYLFLLTILALAHCALAADEWYYPQPKCWEQMTIEQCLDLMVGGVNDHCIWCNTTAGCMLYNACTQKYTTQLSSGDWPETTDCPAPIMSNRSSHYESSESCEEFFYWSSQVYAWLLVLGCGCCLCYGGLSLIRVCLDNSKRSKYERV